MFIHILCHLLLLLLSLATCNRTTLVVNMFRTANDATIPFGLYETETHKVLCTPSIHFNVSSVCHAQDIKTVHEFLPCSAQHVCVHQRACSCDRGTKILQVCHLGVVDNIFDKPPQKKTKGAMSGDCGGQAVGLSRQIQRPEIFLFRTAQTTKAQ